MATNGALNGYHDLVEVPVLIVGGGPSGLLQSYLLAKLDVPSLVIERYPERLGAPKAHALSPRSLEICRQFGLDVKALRSLGTKRKDAFWVNFLTSLSGKSVGVLPYERMDPAVLDETPEMIHNIPQPVFEQFVSNCLASEKIADIRKGVSYVSLEQRYDGVYTTVEERVTGHKFQIKSQYVIACDGARSTVRQSLDIKSTGEDSYETMMTIHFRANLRPVVGDRVGMLHWLFDPMASGFIIAYDLSDNAVLISNFGSDRHPVESWSEDLCQQVLKGALGTNISPQILSYRPWLLSRKVANSYRRGNVFLAGDAAHSFPPTGGLGLNSGLADVHNLAFKIAAVYHGQATSIILDSYETERRPVAEVNSRQSVKNGKQIFGLLKILGTAGIADPIEARKNLSRTITDPTKIDSITEGIEQQREHFDNLNLHIGYVYGDKAVPSHASHYKARFVPGARLPHAWITFKDQPGVQLQPVDVSYIAEFSEADANTRHFSTLDLCRPNAFTFILSSSANDLHDHARSVTKRFARAGLRINTYIAGEDFSLETCGTAKRWLDEAHLTKGGGLLVRPDQHILLQLDSDTGEVEVGNALNVFLGTEF